MPDFTEILKIAVQEQDWKIICGLYKSITGEALQIPEDKEDESADEKNSILEKDYSMEEILGEEKKQEKDIDNSQGRIYNDFTAPSKSDSNEGKGLKNRQMRSQPVGGSKLDGDFVGVSKQGFVDDMTEALVNPETGRLFAEENKSAKITPRNQRASLGMNDTSMINAECSVCGDNKKISKVLSYGFSDIKSQNSWVCNDCNTRKGRLNRSRND